MGKAERKRWAENQKAINIITSKKDKEITQKDIQILKESYTGMGGLLPKGFHNGEFYTPPHVAKFICNYLNIKPNSKVLEPCAGTGVFLEYIPESCEVDAIEINPTSHRISRLINPKANHINGNAFDYFKENYYDYVIGNPPYGEKIIRETNVNNYLTLSKNKGLYKGRSESVFLEYAIKSTKYGGYIAFILPMGIGYQSNAKIRKLIYDTCWHIATIRLPKETFQHVGTKIHTQILVLRKVPSTVKRRKSNDFDAYFFEGQQPSLMVDVKDVGYDCKGRSTDEWGDGLTTLDELLEMIQINGWQTELVRANLYPEIPSWIELGRDITTFPFFSEGCKGYKDAIRYDTKIPYWHERTLGANIDDGSFDFYWQDQIVEDYYKKMEEGNEQIRCK